MCTPVITSWRAWKEASNRMSAVFSKEANISTLWFILSMPCRVMPRISPYTIMMNMIMMNMIMMKGQNVRGST